MPQLAGGAALGIWWVETKQCCSVLPSTPSPQGGPTAKTANRARPRSSSIHCKRMGSGLLPLPIHRFHRTMSGLQQALSKNVLQLKNPPVVSHSIRNHPGFPAAHAALMVCTCWPSPSQSALLSNTWPQAHWPSHLLLPLP